MFKISHHAITQNIESALMGEIFTWDLICEFYPQNFISQGFNFTNLPIEKISQVIPFFGILPKIKAFVSLEHENNKLQGFNFTNSVWQTNLQGFSFTNFEKFCELQENFSP